MEKLFNTRLVRWVVLPLLFFGLIATNVQTCNRAKQTENMYKAARDTNKMYRNENGLLISEKQAIVGTIKDLAGEVKYLETQGDTLKSKLSRSTTSLVLLKKELAVTGSVKPKIIYRDTTIYVGETKVVNPTFLVDTGDTDHHLKISGKITDLSYKLQVFDKSELNTEDLGRKGTKVTVLNHNRYVVSSEATSLIVPPKKKRFLSKVKDGAIGAAVFSVIVTIFK